jgi:hypothetical protein
MDYVKFHSPWAVPPYYRMHLQSPKMSLPNSQSPCTFYEVFVELYGVHFTSQNPSQSILSTGSDLKVL